MDLSKSGVADNVVEPASDSEISQFYRPSTYVVIVIGLLCLLGPLLLCLACSSRDS